MTGPDERDERGGRNDPVILPEPPRPAQGTPPAGTPPPPPEEADAVEPPPRAFFLDGHSATVWPAFLALEQDEAGGHVLVIRTDPVPGAPPPVAPERPLASDPADPAVPRRWRMADLRAIPGQSRPDALIVTHAAHPLARLIVEGPEARAAILSHATHLSRRPPVRGKARIAAWAAAAAASVALIVFGLVPLLANQLAPYLPPEGEKALGDATYEQIRKALSENDFAPIATCENADGLAALGNMRLALEEHANLPYPITVTVLDHEMINAFALPGGRIVFFRGLIDAAVSPNEVAAVLAHEMGHVERRDPTRGALRSAGTFGVLGLLFGDFAGGAAVLMVANQLIEASYSQGAEADADTYAYDVLEGAGVSPVHLGTFFERLRDTYGDSEGLVAHFASHPRMIDRMEAAAAAAEARGVSDEPIITRQEWADLQRVCRGE